MRNKRRKSKVTAGRKAAKDDNKLSNRPFKSQLRYFRGTDDKAEPGAAAIPVDTKAEEDSDTLFQEAMKGVAPLRDSRNKVVKSPLKREEAPEGFRTKEEKERQYFSALVQDSSAWDISFSDEYMVGAVPGVGPQIMKKLKRGEFSVQDYIDLHGLKKVEAEQVVKEFIHKSHKRGLRCVLI
ncbi:MAG: Smr/MutS family protein, partial [Thermodesulfobacteriota bacterium]